MLKIDGYNRLFSELRSLGQPSRPMLEAVVAMAIDGGDSSSENQKLKVNVSGYMSYLQLNELFRRKKDINVYYIKLFAKKFRCVGKYMNVRAFII